MWMAVMQVVIIRATVQLHDLWLKVLVMKIRVEKEWPCSLQIFWVSRRKCLTGSVTGLKRDMVLKGTRSSSAVLTPIPGPVLEAALSDMYPLDDSELRKVKQYSDRLENQVVEITGKALKSMQPVKIFCHNGVYKIPGKPEDKYRIHPDWSGFFKRSKRFCSASNKSID